MANTLKLEDAVIADYFQTADGKLYLPALPSEETLQADIERTRNQKWEQTAIDEHIEFLQKWHRELTQLAEDQTRTTKIIADLYSKGVLTEKGYVRTNAFTAEDNTNCVDTYFVVNLTDILPYLSDDDAEFVKQVLPKSPCIYSGCVGFVHLLMKTYRDTYGCIGRSWETTIVDQLNSANASAVAQVRREQNAYQAGIKSIECLLSQIQAVA